MLLEFCGPLFTSTGATSNMRLSEVEGGTLITFKHTVVGPFPEDHRGPLSQGWTAMHARANRPTEADNA